MTQIDTFHPENPYDIFYNRSILSIVVSAHPDEAGRDKEHCLLYGISSSLALDSKCVLYKIRPEPSFEKPFGKNSIY